MGTKSACAGGDEGGGGDPGAGGEGADGGDGGAGGDGGDTGDGGEGGDGSGANTEDQPDEESPDAIIDTGDAVASADIINVVNTNIFNSNGLIFLLSTLFGANSFDLRNLFNLFGEDTQLGPTTACSLESCAQAGIDLTIHSTSTVQITNNVIVRSITGETT